jgi:hypothetical protein
MDNFDVNAPRHSGICDLCNLSVLDIATQRLLGGRLLKLRQPSYELFIERGLRSENIALRHDADWRRHMQSAARRLAD